MSTTETEKVLEIDNQETFERRVRSAFGYKPVTQIAEEVGISYQKLRNYLVGRSDIPTSELIKLSKSANRSIDWLLTGENYNLDHLVSVRRVDVPDIPPENLVCADLADPIAGKIKTLARREKKNVEEFTADLIYEALLARGEITDKPDGVNVIVFDQMPFGFVEVPLYGEVSAGKPFVIFENPSEMVPIPDFYLKKYGKDLFVTIINGDSMEDDGIWDGDYAICIHAETITNGKRVIAVIDGIDTTIKKFFRRRGKIVLEPANKRYAEQIYEPERVKIEGIVVGLHRQF